MAIRQHSTTIITAITAVIESAINTALKYDPASERAVSELTNVIAVVVKTSTMPEVTVFFTGTPRGVRVMSRCNSPVNTRLSSSPLALFNLLQHPHSFADSGVDLSGDITLLQCWQAVLDNLDIDWQECLQEYLGDIAGPIVATAIGSAGRWLQHQWRYHQHQLSVYLKEEMGVIPAKAELDDFYQQVDDLVLQVDRVQARLQHVRVKLHNSSIENNHVKTIGLKSPDLKTLI